MRILAVFSSLMALIDLISHTLVVLSVFQHLVMVLGHAFEMVYATVSKLTFLSPNSKKFFQSLQMAQFAKLSG